MASCREPTNCSFEERSTASSPPLFRSRRLPASIETFARRIGPNWNRSRFACPRSLRSSSSRIEIPELPSPAGSGAVLPPLVPLTGNLRSRTGSKASAQRLRLQFSAGCPAEILSRMYRVERVAIRSILEIRLISNNGERSMSLAITKNDRTPRLYSPSVAASIFKPGPMVEESDTFLM